MLPNEDLHEELMQAFHDYYKANQRWVSKQSAPSGVELRNRLSEIKRITLRMRDLCDEQRKVIQDWRYANFSAKIPSRRAIAQIKERNQKELDAKKHLDN